MMGCFRIPSFLLRDRGHVSFLVVEPVRMCYNTSIEINSM